MSHFFGGNQHFHSFHFNNKSQFRVKVVDRAYPKSNILTTEAVNKMLQIKQLTFHLYDVN